MTFREALMLGQTRLLEAGIKEPEADAWWLFSEILQISKAQFFLREREEVEAEGWKLYEEALSKRESHVPIQYILHHQYFCGLEFYVDENVLIPRLDTEVLVQEVKEQIGDAEVTLLDMCTGSGCIAIVLTKLCSRVKATGVDLSAGALKVARRNARENHVDIEFIESDLFAKVQGRYDVIVSNPPYIPTEVVKGLDEEVKNHEPILALDGTEDGLRFYRNIVKEAPDFLEKHGMLAFEIGHDQGEAVASMMRVRFENVKVIKDLAGLDRVVLGTLR